MADKDRHERLSDWLRWHYGPIARDWTPGETRGWDLLFRALSILLVAPIMVFSLGIVLLIVVLMLIRLGLWLLGWGGG